MASLSSTGSVSSSNSLGNTSLRGFGGLMSGIDRDSIIEQMTLGETTKINNVKNDITKLGWKQEAYRALSDQIIDITDKYTSYSSSSSLVDPLTFAKSIISTIGSENATRFVKASGSSDMINSISIEAVRQLATAATTRSDTVQTHPLQTQLNDLDKETAISRLNYNGEGAKLVFGKHDGKGWYGNTTFTFPAQYKARDEKGNILYDNDGKAIMKNIDYTSGKGDEIAKQLNYALEDSNAELDGKKLSDRMKFEFEDGKMKIKEGWTGSMNGYGIQSTSSALGALGFTGKGEDGAVRIDNYNANLQSFADASVYRITVLESLTGAKVNFNYNGTQKEIELITKEEAERLKNDETFMDAVREAEIRNGISNVTLSEEEKKVIRDNVEEEIVRSAGLNRDAIVNDIALNYGITEDDALEDTAMEIVRSRTKRDAGMTDEAYEQKVKDAYEADYQKFGSNAGIVKDNIRKELEEVNPGSTVTDDMVDASYTKVLSEANEKKINELEDAQKEAAIKDINDNYAEKKKEIIKKSQDKPGSTPGKSEYEEKIEAAEADAVAVATEAKRDAAVNAEKQKNKLTAVQESLQNRLDKAFGKDKIEVSLNEEDGTLSFRTINKTGDTVEDSNVSLSITAGSSGVAPLWELGITAGASNKINLNGSLKENMEAFRLTDEDELKNLVEGGLKINGVTIDGITEDSSIGSILSKINASDAGVKATYIESTGQFMLVADEMGSGRTIDLGDENSLAFKIFGSKISENSQDGKDAIIDVSYGNGMTVTMNPSSNTFNLEGLTVTVSGVFGGDYAADGTWKPDTSERVSFSAAADVDAVTEKVKTFFEDYNKLVTEVYNQLTTRSDSSYGPLTDEQKAEMSETSIENWETKAKQGILYNDSVIRDLNSTLEGFLTQLMGSGIKYQDLEKIGITYDESWGGGASTIVFNESKFRSAMETEPELVSDIFTGTGKTGGVGLAKTVENMFTPYATRIASKNRGSGSDKGSYGRLIEEAGSEKVPTSVMNNFIYDQIKEMNKKIETLQAQLKTKQERYIKQFTSMETLINQYNSQSSYLSNISG